MRSAFSGREAAARKWLRIAPRHCTGLAAAVRGLPGPPAFHADAVHPGQANECRDRRHVRATPGPGIADQCQLGVSSCSMLHLPGAFLQDSSFNRGHAAGGSRGLRDSEGAASALARQFGGRHRAGLSRITQRSLQSTPSAASARPETDALAAPQIENDRLYTIIQSLQKGGAAIDAAVIPPHRPGSDSSSVETSDGGSHERMVRCPSLSRDTCWSRALRCLSHAWMRNWPCQLQAACDSGDLGAALQGKMLTQMSRRTAAARF